MRTVSPFGRRWTITLGIVAILCFFSVIWFYRRQKRYLQKDLKEVVSAPMKKELNLKADVDDFGRHLDKKNLRPQPSKDILKDLNRD